MKKYLQLLAIGLIASTLATPASGQNLSSSPCPSGTSNLGIPDAQRAAQDACTQAFDVFQFMAPQLAIALGGGNATLGQGGTLGGLGRFSVGIRANALLGLLPDVPAFQQSMTGARRSVLPTVDQIIGLPTADAAIGVFKGVPSLAGKIGGLDLLISGAYLPTIDTEEIDVTPSQNLQIGYGARVGLISEGPVIPGVAVTVLRRALPKTEIVGTSGGNSFTVSDMELKTTAWRLVAGKSVLALTLAGGVGRDTYTQGATISATVTGPFSGTATVPGTSQSMTRTNYFLDASLNLPVLKITGAVGRVSGGTADTFSSFAGGAADRDLTYFSVGLRLAVGGD